MTTPLKEMPVDAIFAPAAPYNWLAPGVDPNLRIKARPTVFPTHWRPNPAQPICGPPYKEVRHGPWFYGEKPDLQRLIGNATPGYGS